jgi:hypothetical protein
MEPGFYFSIWDRTNQATIALVKGQLTELLSNYGDIKKVRPAAGGWLLILVILSCTFFHLINVIITTSNSSGSREKF